MSSKEHLSIATEVFRLEAEAVKLVSSRLDASFNQAVEIVLGAKGRVVVSGMGKSGLVGAKIAATLASTGTPSFFMHPAEGNHGDLGMLQSGDVLLAISFSGETEEMLKLLPFVSDNGNQVIAITGNSNSTLAKYANTHLDVSIEREACPLDLAPTSSTTVTMVMGDALAAALMEARSFKPENFARLHPGGNLGYRLLTTVDSVMRKEALPSVTPSSAMFDVIQSISEGKLGMTLVMSEEKLVGVITDGDLRRATKQFQNKLIDLTAQEIMTASPICIVKDTKLESAKNLMNEKNITCLVVADGDKALGIVQLFDCHL